MIERAIAAEEPKQQISVLFHGPAARAFRESFEELLPIPADVQVLPDALDCEEQRAAYKQADVIVSWRFDRTMPLPERLKLFHVPGAGYEGVDLEAVPSSAVVCNCFGHEQAMAEYVMTAILQRQVPLAEADRLLRQGEWAFRAGPPENMHDELAGRTIGLLGFGHIGRAIAVRAKAFEMRVHVANRTPVPPSDLVDRGFSLRDLADFWGSVDYLVASLPLTPETAGIVGAAAFQAMRPAAVLINVGRGPTVDETALYEALRDRRIAGAVIDTWYNYPPAGESHGMPSTLPFHTLPNLVMTPHMSAWTRGTLVRRQRTIADNIERVLRGEECRNIVRPARSGG